MAYYEVKVAYQTGDAKGNIKTKKETLLVEAVSVTDSEATLVKHLTDAGETREYEVVGSNESKITELVLRGELDPSKGITTGSTISSEDDETPF